MEVINKIQVEGVEQLELINNSEETVSKIFSFKSENFNVGKMRIRLHDIETVGLWIQCEGHKLLITSQTIKDILSRDYIFSNE